MRDYWMTPDDPARTAGPGELESDHRRDEYTHEDDEVQIEYVQMPLVKPKYIGDPNVLPEKDWIAVNNVHLRSWWRDLIAYGGEDDERRYGMWCSIQYELSRV